MGISSLVYCFSCEAEHTVLITEDGVFYFCCDEWKPIDDSVKRID